MAALEIWTIYDHPKDYPDRFVARRHDVDGAGPVATDHVITAPDLATLRKAMIVLGLTCLTRQEEDDPVIVETWM